jgi:hypothetical protein
MTIQAYGGLAIQDGGAQTQALTTTAGQMVAWSAALGGGSAADSYNNDGDPAVRPDPANNRLLLKGPPGPKNTLPGQPDPYSAYQVDFDCSLLGGGSAQDVVAQLYVNGVKRADASCRASCSSSGRTNMGFSYILKLTPADNPKTIADFAEPGSTPYPRYVGAGGAPETEVPVAIYLSTLASTLSVTIEAAHLTAQKMA